MKSVAILVLMLACLSSHAQMLVRDKNKTNQLKSQEYMQWKFTPEWYYYSWYYKRIWGVRVRMPGLGVHDRGPGGIGGGDRYVRSDKRNILQEAPTIAFTNITKNNAEEQHKNTDIVYKQELAKFVDKTIDYQYTLSKSTRDNLVVRIENELAKYSKNKGDPKHIKTLNDEVLRILSNVKIIKDSHMSNSKKREAYLQYENELKEVLSYATKLNNFNKLIYE